MSPKNIFKSWLSQNIKTSKIRFLNNNIRDWFYSVNYSKGINSMIFIRG